MLRDPRSSLESKEFLFPGRDAPDKISGGGQSAVAPDTSKICALTTGTPRLGCFLTNANRNACASNCHRAGRLVDSDYTEARLFAICFVMASLLSQTYGS